MPTGDELLRDEDAPTAEDWFADGERLQALSPGLRLFRVHPDLGVEEQEEGVLSVPRAGELSVAWLALPIAEQELRLRDVRRALLAHAAREEDARVLVAAHDDVPLVAALRSLPDRFEETGAGWFEGRLDEDAVALLAAHAPLPRVRVTCGGRLWLVAGEDDDEEPAPSLAGVWHDPFQAPALQGEVTEGWWGPAQERRAAAAGLPAPPPRDGGRVSRETRAHVHHLLGRFFGRYAGALVAGFVGCVVADTWVNALVVVVVAVAVIWTIDEAVTGWYERS